jgi:hypothetical protein
MSTITFDKMAYIDTLKAAGIDEAHARAQANALDAALKDTVATKYDLVELKVDLMKWILGLLLGQTAVIVTLIKLL